MSDRARTRNREIGFIFQSFNLIGDLTVYENVELPLTYRGMRPVERRQRVNEALEKVEMAHRAKHLPEPALRRPAAAVAVARAVAGQPSILLADEPTGNLEERRGGDAASREPVRRRVESPTTRATPSTLAARCTCSTGRWWKASRAKAEAHVATPRWCSLRPWPRAGDWRHWSARRSPPRHPSPELGAVRESTTTRLLSLRAARTDPASVLADGD